MFLLLERVSGRAPDSKRSAKPYQEASQVQPIVPHSPCQSDQVNWITVNNSFTWPQHECEHAYLHCVSSQLSSSLSGPQPEGMTSSAATCTFSQKIARFDSTRFKVTVMHFGKVYCDCTRPFLCSHWLPMPLSGMELPEHFGFTVLPIQTPILYL